MFPFDDVIMDFICLVERCRLINSNAVEIIDGQKVLEKKNMSEFYSLSLPMAKHRWDNGS